MIKSIRLQRFKSFNDLEFRITGSKGSPQNIVLVYGENGAGKTNLTESFAFLRDSVLTLSPGDTINPLADEAKGICYLDPCERKETSMPELCSEVRMIGSDDGPSITVTMSVDGHDARYELSMDARGFVVYEALNYMINDRSGRYFSISSENASINAELGPTIFSSEYKGEICGLIDRYWGRHTLLSIVRGELVRKNEGFMEASVREGLRKVIAYIEGIWIECPSGSAGHSGLQGLMSGTISRDAEKVLDAYEGAMSRFFRRITPDFERAWYDRRDLGGRIRYELMFDKKISGTVRQVPASSESSGIRRLISMLPALLAYVSGRVVVIDEMDSGVHVKLICDMISELRLERDGQLIITTHNVSLMSDADPKSVFVMSSDLDGDRTVSSLASIARTQRTNNNAVRYMNGLFGGIPCPAMLDFPNILRGFESSLK